MTFWRDRLARRFALYLIGFALALLGALALLACGHSAATRRALRRHDEAVASSLLMQGVAQDVVAVALTSEADTPEGTALLARQGLLGGEHPAMRGVWAGGMLSALPAWGALSAALLLGTAAFLTRRERAYRVAADALERFAEGDWDAPLPEAQEGTFSRMLASAAQLARMLRAQGESEHAGRVFLREMIPDIAHQLRTPLAVMSIYQEMIVGEADDGQSVRRFGEKMGEAIERMKRLVERFLRLARLDAGGIVFEREMCELGELARMATGELAARAGREGKALLLSGEPGLTLWCDRQLTAEAVGNVVKNALDHTKRGAVIRVSWSATPLLARITVADDGPGIPPEDINHIFKRFYRGAERSGAERSGAEKSGAEKSGAKGTGLGLPLALAIAEGQGGTLGVSSAEGRGAVFTFSFPQERNRESLTKL